MWVARWVAFCPVCEDRTPHSRHRVPGRLIFGGSALGASVWAAVATGWLWVLLPGAAALAWSLASDRSRLRRYRCERCRTNEWRRLRKGRVTLDGNTEVFYLG